MQIRKTDFCLIIPAFHKSKKGDDFSKLLSFTERKISCSSQLTGSPLLGDNSPFISCLELQQRERRIIGIRNNEGCTYILDREGIDFAINKIKVWLFEGGIGFITIDIGTEALSSDDALNLTSRLCNISKRSKIVYEQRVDKNNTEIRQTSIYDMLQRLFSMKDEIRLESTPKTYTKAKLLFYGVGEVFEGDNYLMFLEMLRNQSSSNARPAQGLGDKNCLKPFEYIIWATSENVMAAMADIKKCGVDNEGFITGRGGLVQSIFSNYLIVYLNCIAVNMRIDLLQDKYNLNDASAITSCSEEGLYALKSVLNLPLRNMTNELHINELFEKYYCDQSLALFERLDKFSKCEQLKILDDLNTKVENISERMDSMEKKLESIVNFVENDMKRWLGDKKLLLEKAEDEETDDSNVSEFIQDSSMYINEQIKKADDVVAEETDALQELFGDIWWGLKETSRNSLVSASVLWRSCSNINKKDFDFSGICISATSALESELKRVFFDGFQLYMKEKYGEPDKNNWKKTFAIWPERLLSSTKFDYGRKINDGKKPRLECQTIFTMGQLPYLMGKMDNRSNAEQKNMIVEKMNEYLKTIVKYEYSTEPINYFYNSDSSCFVKKCEEVRTAYRNPAAHSDILDKDSAEQCYMMVVGKREAETYISEIAGLIITLYKCLKEGIKI